MHIKKTNLAPDGVSLPYIIKVDNPKYTFGIFGDSFAQLAEHANLNTKLWEGHDKPIYNHEFSWQYFLSNLLDVETHSYGISFASMGDIAYTILNTTIEYDYYIIFHTYPLRNNLFSDGIYTVSLYKQIKNFLANKKVLEVYWSKTHKIKSFGHKEYYTTFHITHKNRGENFLETVDYHSNPLDISGSTAHMSARGNLLLARELHKIIASQLKF